MTGEYVVLKGMQSNQGYKVLQALWAHQGIRIMDAMQKAAARGNESSWRYYAGQMKGFDLAISQLERSLIQMEKEFEGDSPATNNVEELLSEIKGKGDGK